MIRVARRQALDEATKSAQTRAWRERFLTLTLPHSGEVVRDLRVLPEAWKWFRRRLWLFFKHEHRLDSELLKRVAFVRVVEVTPGSNDDGHAHLHVYLLCPYLPHELVRHLWGQALRKHGFLVPVRSIRDVLNEAKSQRSRRQLERVLVTRRGKRGVPLTDVDWPVVDLRACNANVERELVKYLVKDAEIEHGKLNFIDAKLYARIYEGLEGVRTIATSRHFYVKTDRVCACDKCGSTRLSTRAVKQEEPPTSTEEGAS
jgi:hypothetical protein